MTVTVDLSPEIERALVDRATELGISPAEYLVRLAEREARTPSPTQDAAAEPDLLKELDQWLKADPGIQAAPPVPLEALSREAIYAERDSYEG